MPPEWLFDSPIWKKVLGELPPNEPPSLRAQRFRYQKGDIIARQGESIESLYILTRGKVRTEMLTPTGDSLQMEFLEAPQPLASAFLFAEEHRFPVDVIAQEACELVCIAKDNVLEHLASDINFLESYLRFNAKRTQFLSERVRLLTIKGISEKMLYYFRLKADSDGRFRVTMNQRELAEYLGVSRPALARCLRELRESGKVELWREDLRRRGSAGTGGRVI